VGQRASFLLRRVLAILEERRQLLTARRRSELYYTRNTTGHKPASPIPYELATIAFLCREWTGPNEPPAQAFNVKRPEKPISPPLQTLQSWLANHYPSSPPTSESPIRLNRYPAPKKPKPCEKSAYKICMTIKCDERRNVRDVRGRSIFFYFFLEMAENHSDKSTVQRYFEYGL